MARPGVLGGPMARGVGKRGGAGRAGGGRRVPRWRGGDSTAAAADSGGEKLGKIEEGAIELTGDRFGAEDGRKVVVDERGEARGGASMVDGGLVRDFVQVGAQPCSWVVGVGGR